MEHVISYDLARGLHIIGVIAWVAGLLMLPRFYAYITASAPGGELDANWLPSPAAGEFKMTLRVYMPVPELVEAYRQSALRVPPIERLQ